MTAWDECPYKTCRFLFEDVEAPDLKRGDIVVGFHREVFKVIEEAPTPHPSKKGWWTYQASNRHGIGHYVMTPGATLAIGRIPLTPVPGSASILAPLQASCGCIVSNARYCDTCGPYNYWSPQYRGRKS